MKDHIYDAIGEAIERVDRHGHLSREVFLEGMKKEGYSEREIVLYGKEKEKRERAIDLARRR